MIKIAGQVPGITYSFYVSVKLTQAKQDVMSGSDAEAKAQLTKYIDSSISNFGYIRQYFNPGDYQEDGELGYIKDKAYSDLMSWNTGTITRAIGLQRDNCSFYDD